MTAMKKNESSLPADLQAMLQETHKAQSQDMTKVLHSAVTKLGKAKKTLQDARASRMQLHNVWKNYLAASVDKWKDFCQDFEKQDSELAQQVMSATDAVKAAQEGLEASKKEAREVEDLDSDSKNDMALEISDEESQEMLDTKGQALKEGLTLMLTNLESLKEKAEIGGRGKRCQEASKKTSRWSYRAIFAVFWCARSIDRQEIGYGLPLHGDTAPCVLKWLHPAVRKRHFVSEWQANIDALDEAFALGFADGPQPVPSPSLEAPTKSKSLRTCSFADSIQLAFGLEDEYQTVSTSLPHESLQHWADKPWKLRSRRTKTRAGRFFAEDQTEPPCIVLRRSPRGAEEPSYTRSFLESPNDNLAPGHMTDPNFLPSWWQQLRSMHDRLGLTECLEEGKVIYVCSWYLHGNTRRSSIDSRILRLDSDWSEWLELIKDMWQDLLHRDQPVDIGLVMPHPPSTVFQGHVAHLILCQGVDPEIASVGIVSAYYRHSSRDVIAQQARVLPTALSRENAIDFASANLHCTIRHCQVSIGDISLREEEQDLPTPWCTSIVIEVFPTEEDIDDYSSFMAAGARSRTQTTSLQIMDGADAVQQEGDIEEEQASSSESEPDLAWSHSAVFSVHGPPQEGYVNTVHDVNGPLTRRNVARLARFAYADLRTVHPVLVPPRDLRDRGLRAFLAQHCNDLPDQSRLAFVLVDVEFHPAGPGTTFDRVRCPLYVPTVLSPTSDSPCVRCLPLRPVC